MSTELSGWSELRSKTVDHGVVTATIANLNCISPILRTITLGNSHRALYLYYFLGISQRLLFPPFPFDDIS
jgi:hypothetical protein